jgi:hypothetical protein
MKRESIISMVNDINNGDWDDFSDLFNNDISKYISFVNKAGLLDMIDPTNEAFEEIENALLLSLIDTNPEKWYKFIREKMINSDLAGENLDYLHINDLEKLSEFFDDGGRDTSARSAANHVLGEDYWEPFYDVTTDIYDDVIDDLDNKNLQLLKNRMFEVLNGVSVDAETDTLMELNTDESDDTITITSENFKEIFNDEDTLRFLLKEVDEVGDIKNDLYNIHTNAYNTAYTDEIYNDVWSELGTYFEGKPEYHSAPSRYNAEKTNTWYTIKIKDVNSVIYTWLKENSTSTWNDDRISYYGNFSSILLECMNRGYVEYLDFRIPDYADWGRVKKNINENFADYF